MSTRRIIRILFAVPFFIFFCAWGWNYFYDEWLSFSDAYQRQTTLAIADHDICFAWRLQTSTPPGWYFDHITKWKKTNYRRATHFSILVGIDPDDTLKNLLSRIGIYIGGTIGSGEYYAYIPLWIPILISAGALAIGWQKTRKLLAGRAFTVEQSHEPRHTPHDSVPNDQR